jgi:hypothetical protein
VYRVCWRLVRAPIITDKMVTGDEGPVHRLERRAYPRLREFSRGAGNLKNRGVLVDGVDDDLECHASHGLPTMWSGECASIFKAHGLLAGQNDGHRAVA